MKFIAAFVSLALPTLASGAGLCAKEEAIAAEGLATRVGSWTAMHRAFKDFGHCDDGSIAEGFSEAVARLFTVPSHRLDELDPLAKRDPAFRAFLLRHVDATLTLQQLADIDREVRTACPESAGDLCKDISSSVMRARREQER